MDKHREIVLLFEDEWYEHFDIALSINKRILS